MTTEDWKHAKYELRRLVHGFHHNMCATNYFHEPGPDCECERLVQGTTCWSAKTDPTQNPARKTEKTDELNSLRSDN